MTALDAPAPTFHVLHDIAIERAMQNGKWGEQNHPDGTDNYFDYKRDDARRICESMHRLGRGTWHHILAEEFWEAMTEEDPAKLRAELIQVAAVAAAWAEAIDRRTARDEVSDG